MLQEFTGYISKENLVRPGDRTLLAVSGGMDSVAMAWLFQKAGLEFAICHANFMLRGEESMADEEFVRLLSGNFGVPFFSRRFETAEYARSRKLPIQVAARNLRYEWFESLLDEHGYTSVATAHHKDDETETFLINLARGTGIAGLHGIRSRNGRVIRPLMFTGRAGISRLVEEQRLQFREDSSNKSLKYVRNRIRWRVIPELQRINPSFGREIHETIRRIRDAEAIYRNALEEGRRKLLLNDGDVGFRIPIKDLKERMPLATWLYEMISGFGFNRSVVADIAGTLDSGSGRLFYSGTHQLLIDRDHIYIRPVDPETGAHAKETPTFIPEGVRTVNIPVRLELEVMAQGPFAIPVDKDEALLDMDLLSFPLSLRRWKRGDSFIPLGMKGRKKLSDFFTDLKFSRFEKEQVWLLCSGGDIVWIVGMRPDERYKITVKTRRALAVKYVRT